MTLMTTKPKHMICAVAALSAAAVLAPACHGAGRDIASWVDPFIGTSGTGHTFPAACVPFGMVKAGPDTGTGDWEHCSGYQFGDREIVGFSQTHLSGTGCPDMGDVSILPICEHATNRSVRVAFDKRSEVSEPGYYAVTLEDGTRCEATATERCAFYRFTYARTDARMLVNLPFGIGNLPRESWGGVRMREAEVSDDGESEIRGMYLRDGWATGRRVGFQIRFSRPWKALHRAASEHEGDPPRMLAEFEVPPGGELLVKIGLSAKGAAGAGCNLAAEIPGWDFAGTRRAASNKWNELLGRIEIEGSDEQKKVFYTALYHLFLHPDDISDHGERPFYSTFSTWDTFRAAHPLYTILIPERVPDMVDSMLRQGKITGYLPIWPLGGVETQCMVGTHSVPVIVDWFLKERELEPDAALSPERLRYWEAAYAQIKDTLLKTHSERLKERWDLYDRHGYYPFDEIKGESVSRTMECAYDDWCAGVMARELGHAEDAAFFAERSRNWLNVFDPAIGLVRGKDSQGRWREPYNPYKIGQGAYTENDFTEGNAFQYTWHVLHDPAGLIEAMGGREKFVQRLDALFEEPEKVKGAGFDADITGLIGQYVHGNEPSHHVIYLYTLAGQPEKAAARIREIFDRFYSAAPDGLCGNEDCGQMSAWYIFSALGMYPFNPCGGEYVLGAPQLPKAVIKLTNGKRFTIVAKNLSFDRTCVKSTTLDGNPPLGLSIRHCEIIRGGELTFEMQSPCRVKIRH